MEISDKTKRRICSLAARGVKYKDISKEVGISENTIAKIAVGMNCRNTMTPCKIPREILDEWDSVTRQLRKYFAKRDSVREVDEFIWRNIRKEGKHD